MPTSSHPEAIVRHYYELVDAGKLDELLALFHDEIVYQRQGTPDITGMAAMRRFYEEERIIDSGRHEIAQVLTDGSWVAVRGLFEGRLKSGASVKLRFTDWHRFRDGKIDRRETLFPGPQI
jgi:ketosteroid isomerase-like protein